MLDAHPAVFMAKPVRPEPKYFMQPESATASYSAYAQAYFGEAGGAAWLGEKSTSYIEHEAVAQRIVAVIPDARVVVILRDPVERAISNYFFTRAHGMEPHDLDRALEEEATRLRGGYTGPVSVSPYAYVQRGKYLEYLECWSRYFGENRMMILIAESFIGNSSAIGDLYRWLGIDTHVEPLGIHDRVNAGRADLAVAVCDEQRDRLAELFKPWNERLADRFDLDVSCWRGMS